MDECFELCEHNVSEWYGNFQVYLLNVDQNNDALIDYYALGYYEKIFKPIVKRGGEWNGEKQQRAVSL